MDEPSHNQETQLEIVPPEQLHEDAQAADDSDEALLGDVEQSLEEINLGFDYDALNVLDDEDARPAHIEALKDQLGTVIAARLFSLANSVHYGKMASGQITRFVDVVKHLGTETTKSTAIFIALMGLSDSRQTREIFARNYATSQLADVLAGQLGVRGNVRSRIALGGLFIEMGKIIMLLYNEKTGTEVDAGFIEKYHTRVGVKVIEKFALPEALAAIISHQHFTFVKKESLGTLAIVHMAHAVMDSSFARHGKLVVQSAMPDPEGILYKNTVGSTLMSHFQIMGLSAYLRVIPTEPTEQEKRLLEKYAQS